MSFHGNLIGGSRANQGADGFNVQQIFYIEALTGAIEERITRALSHDSIPNYGDPHRFLGGTFVSSITAEADDDSTGARVIVEYSPPNSDNQQPGDEASAPAELSLDTGTITEQTFRDFRGDKMIVSYTGIGASKVETTNTTDPTTGEVTTTKTTKRGAKLSVRTTGLVDVDRSLVTITALRNETRLPLDKALAFNDTVNDKPFLGKPAFTWLCKIHARQDGAIFRVSYILQHKPDQWRVIVTVGDDGAIPDEAEIGNGQAAFDLYELANFDALGISFG